MDLAPTALSSPRPLGSCCYANWAGVGKGSSNAVGVEADVPPSGTWGQTDIWGHSINSPESLDTCQIFLFSTLWELSRISRMKVKASQDSEENEPFKKDPFSERLLFPTPT